MDNSKESKKYKTADDVILLLKYIDESMVYVDIPTKLVNQHNEKMKVYAFNDLFFIDQTTVIGLCQSMFDCKTYGKYVDGNLTLNKPIRAKTSILYDTIIDLLDDMYIAQNQRRGISFRIRASTPNSPMSFWAFCMHKDGTLILKGGEQKTKDNMTREDVVYHFTDSPKQVIGEIRKHFSERKEKLENGDVSDIFIY